MPHRAVARLSTEHPLLVSLILLLIVVIPGFWRTQQAIDAATEASITALHATQQNQRNSVVACQNANSQRVANRILWEFVLNVSARQKRNQNPQARLINAEFKAWIADLFAERDCTDLNRKYPIPPPPDIPGLKPTNR